MSWLGGVVDIMLNYCLRSGKRERGSRALIPLIPLPFRTPSTQASSITDWLTQVCVLLGKQCFSFFHEAYAARKVYTVSYISFSNL